MSYHSQIIKKKKGIFYYIQIGKSTNFKITTFYKLKNLWKRLTIHENNSPTNFNDSTVLKETYKTGWK